MRAPTSPCALVVVGLVGATLAAAGSYWTAATPGSFRTDPPPVVDLLGPQAPPARVLWYGGLLLLVLAWLGFGRLLWRGVDVGWRRLRSAALVWSVPFLLSMPAGSRDLWAYAAQARIAADGLDPYAVGPSVLGGVFARNVTPRWIDTPSPYGPLWTLLTRAAAAVFGHHDVPAVFLLRLPAAAGLVLLAATLPAFTRRVGGSPAVACWVAVANPMVVEHGVGGGHNDLLMVGLTSAGLLAAVAGGPRWRALLLAGALVGAGVAVKLPAVVAVPFLPLVRAWAAGADPTARTAPAGAGPGGLARAVRADAGRVARGLVPAVAGAAVVVVAATVAEGHGLGWLTAANTADHGGGPAGSALLLVVLAGAWLAAFGRPPLPLLAFALLAVSLVSRFSPAWYWFWPFGVAAAWVRGRLATFAVAVVSVTEVFYIRPNGQSLLVRPELAVSLAAVLCFLVLDHRWRPLAGGDALHDDAVEPLPPGRRREQAGAP